MDFFSKPLKTSGLNGMGTVSEPAKDKGRSCRPVGPVKAITVIIKKEKAMGIVKKIVDGVEKHFACENIGKVARNEGVIKEFGGRSIYNGMMDTAIGRYKK
jgi:hypothetical protein